jgi:alanyl-tRNA synthetase
MAAAEGEHRFSAVNVRQEFIDFFVKKKEHTFVPSSAVVPLHDPTLLFANAGMNQYKPIFLGQVESDDKVLYGLKRATNSQKCIRAGGKHNDLEDVGKDVYHHTFFEMLGNWSFGDFFKKEACAYAWELLTDVWGLDKDRLYVTYFGGDEDMGLPADDEAKQIWLDLGLDPSKILPFDKVDNFWEMGELGPCGPCTEMHYDRIGGRDAAHLVNMDDPDVLEIWNLVFMQYNCTASKPTKVLEELPAKHIDTGMGLERIVSVLQDKSSNYDTDVFDYIFKAIQERTGTREYTGLVTKAGEKPTHDEMIDMSYRVVADHIRTLSFALADGAKIGNNGRDYVLKRICRRACRYARQFLNAKAGFFSGLVPVVVERLGGFFPELVPNAAQVQEDIAEDEIAFYMTLDRGIKKFEKMVSEMADGCTVFSGKDAFMLSDTFGFPYDLTELMCEERCFTIDEAEYNRRLEEQRAQSRKTAGEGVKELVLIAKQTAELGDSGIPATVTALKYEWDASNGTGTTHQGSVQAIFTGSDLVQEAAFQEDGGDDNYIGLIVNQTPFYYESGGQTSDTGTITVGDSKFRVSEVKLFGGYVLHMGTLASGSVKVSDEVIMEVDYQRRLDCAKNHTGTHLLNWSLRQVLSNPADQMGSLNMPEKLRFDFTCPKQISDADLGKVEQFVIDCITADQVINTKEVPQADALQIHSLRTMFGEHYPDIVRVVVCGKSVDEMVADPTNTDWAGYSIEFCGGTHLASTKQIGDFVITKQESVSKGTRRVECLTGEYATNARDAAKELVDLVTAAAALGEAQRLIELKALERRTVQTTLSTSDRASVDGMIKAERKKLLAYEKEQQKIKKDKAVKDAVDLANKLVGGAQRACVLELEGDKTILTDVIKNFMKIAPEIAICCVGTNQSADTLTVICEVPAALRDVLPANEWCAEAAKVAGGKGGGNADRAQGACKGAFKQAEAVCEAGVMFANSKLN